MRKTVILLLLSFLLSACGGKDVDPPIEPTVEPVSTIAETQPAPATTAPPEMELPHSEFYLPGVEADTVIQYFGEVCLDAEMIHSGNPSMLQKWTVPIRYHIYGSPTQVDVRVLDSFFDWLNALEGFPGICPAQEGEMENLRIHFCDEAGMISRMGEEFRGLDGAVTFWYNDNEIYEAMICYRTDIDQYTRNSVILEELYNGLGPIQDTALRPDSIIYAGFSQPQQLTELDELILKLLYHPDILCGMDAAQCAGKIRQLYY